LGAWRGISERLDGFDVFLREIGPEQCLQRLLWRRLGGHLGQDGHAVGAGPVGRLGQHRLTRIEVCIEAAVGQAGLLHDLGDAGATVTAPPDGTRGGFHNALVGDFLAAGGSSSRSSSTHMISIIYTLTAEGKGQVTDAMTNP
jgi:hypothetical protein